MATCDCVMSWSTRDTSSRHTHDGEKDGQEQTAGRQHGSK